MAVLVTGVGYIGSALATRLLADGMEVVAVENFYSTPRAPVMQLATNRRFTLIEGSITDPATLARAFVAAEIDTVFHLAAQASAHPDAAPIAYTEDTNFAGTWRVLEACVAHRVGRIVLGSSTRLYRTPLPKRVHEGSAIAADDLVHLSQLYGEVLLKTFLAAHGGSMSAVAARLGIVHGLGPVMKTDPHFLAVPQRFCQDAARGETLTVATGPGTVLPFVHLDDAVEGLLRCLDYSGEPVVNVAGEVRSVASVADAVRAAAAERGLRVSVRKLGRVPRPNPRRIESALAPLGFNPVLRVEDSAGAVLDHYRAILSARA